jgi:ubiquinone/menaquinone biosynthesis C-methylase UbiE
MPRATRWAKALGRRLRCVFPARLRVRRLAPQDAYRLWSNTYEAETDNVVLALEQEIFGELLSNARLAGKVVIDIGSGTGRHWDQLLSRGPPLLHAVDNSADMLSRLRMRYPDATVHLRAGTKLEQFADGSVDLIVSALMLGHVREVEDELLEWARLLRPGGEIVVTDFHPKAIEAGMRRTFTYGSSTFEVEHHVHGLGALRSLFAALHWKIEVFQERALDASVRASFERQNYVDAYRSGFGVPLVFGFRLRKTE